MAVAASSSAKSSAPAASKAAASTTSKSSTPASTGSTAAKLSAAKAANPGLAGIGLYNAVHGVSSPNKSSPGSTYNAAVGGGGIASSPGIKTGYKTSIVDTGKKDAKGNPIYQVNSTPYYYGVGGAPTQSGGGGVARSLNAGIINPSPAAAPAQASNPSIKLDLESLRKSLGASPDETLHQATNGLVLGVDQKTGNRYHYDLNTLQRSLFSTGTESKDTTLPKEQVTPPDQAVDATDLGKNAQNYLDKLNSLMEPVLKKEKDQLEENDKMLQDSLDTINSTADAQRALLEQSLGLAAQRRTANIENVRNLSTVNQMELANEERGRARALKGRLANLGALGTTGSAELSVSVLGEQYDVASKKIDTEANASINDLNVKYEDFVQSVNKDITLNESERSKLLLSARQQAYQIKATILQSQASRKANLALTAFQMAKQDLDQYNLDKKQEKQQQKELLLSLIEKGADIPQALKDSVLGKNTTAAQLAEISRSATNRDTVSKGIAQIYDYLRTNFGVSGDPVKRKQMIDTITDAVNSGKMTVDEGLQLAWSTVSTNPTVKKRLDQIGQEADLNLAIKKKQLATMGKGSGSKPVDMNLVQAYAQKVASGEYTVSQIPNDYLGAVTEFLTAAGLKVPSNASGKYNLVQPDLLNKTPGGYVSIDPATGKTSFYPIDYNATPGVVSTPAESSSSSQQSGDSSGNFWTKLFGG